MLTVITSHCAKEMYTDTNAGKNGSVCISYLG